MNPTKLKIVTEHEVELLVRKWKKNQEKVVFTNGCFDILHLGHIDYLEKSRNLGDRLIVGVNSDESVKRLKGASRPFNNENARLRLIAALDFVDAVIRFDEDTPDHVIQLIFPDILVKGKDYEESNIAGSDIVLGNGGRVERIELLQGYSTSGLVEKIQSLKRG